MPTDNTYEFEQEYFDLPRPEGYEGPVSVETTAFADCLYITYPRMDGTGTSQYCADAIDVFQATVNVDRDLNAEPALRKFAVLYDDSFVDDDEIIVHNPNQVDEYHWFLVETVQEVLSGVKEDPYWQGYVKGATSTWMEEVWTIFEEEWDGDEELMAESAYWLSREGMAVCARAKALFPIPEWSSPTGSYVNTISSLSAGVCPECEAPKSESWEVVSSSSRTRVADVYQCQQCGHKKKGITTG